MTTEEKQKDYETWKANGRIVLYKYDRTGGLEETLVNSGRKIQLTEQERLLNQDRCYDESSDPFVNGTLSPVRLPESSAESTKAIVESPNTMTEEEMVELLNGHHKTFESKLSGITSPYVVRKMIALTQEDVDEGGVDVTIKRVEALESRLRDLTTDVKVIEHVNPR